MNREQRMIQRQKAEKQRCWEVMRHLESQGEFRRESHSSLRQGQTITIPKGSDTYALSLIYEPNSVGNAESDGK